MTQLRFILLILSPQHARPVPLAEGTTVIGRDSGVDLILADPLVSRRHAQIICQNDQCILTDLGSANGTFINGLRLSPNVPAPLIDGASLRFGQVDCQFKVEGSAASADQQSQETVDQPLGSSDEVNPAHEVPSSSPSGSTGGPPPPLSDEPEYLPSGELPIPPGLGLHSQRLLNYLPGIYHNDFMARFLGIFEAILTPIEWNIDNFDLYLDPETSPDFFLLWLANWYEITFDATWQEDQRRQLLAEAHQLYARRGTRWALARLIEIYTGSTPEIIDTEASLDPYTFRVRLPQPTRRVNPEMVTRLINIHKPAYTTFSLEFL